MNNTLPTGSFATWNVTAFKDSLDSVLKSDHKKGNATLYLYFYAVTIRGWREISKNIKRWNKFDPKRKVSAYIGTDHAITDPAGLEAMYKDGVAVRLMKNYRGIYHPKVIWLERSTKCQIWVGSNNLTRDGLLNNIEFAVTIRCNTTPQDLRSWADEVHLASVQLTPENLESYRIGRHKFESNRMKSRATAFTWDQKEEPVIHVRSLAKSGDLIIEIMPKETGVGGKQIQIPMSAARNFFDLNESKTITLIEKGRRSKRTLTLTLFKNYTARFVINELEYRDRPCVILFHKTKSDRYQFEIIKESISPSRYKTLIKLCTCQARSKSRRWGIVQNP